MRRLREKLTEITRQLGSSSDIVLPPVRQHEDGTQPAGQEPAAAYAFVAISPIRHIVAAGDKAAARRCSNARTYRPTSSLPCSPRREDDSEEVTAQRVDDRVQVLAIDVEHGPLCGAGDARTAAVRSPPTSRPTTGYS